MKVMLAEIRGLCIGVRRALQAVEKLSAEKPVTVFGSLIHNPPAVRRLEKAGVTFTDDPEQTAGKTTVISAHGISNHVRRDLETNADELIDLTCGHVKQIHDRILKLHDRGKFIVVLGDPRHTEVKGFTGDLEHFHIIRNADEITAVHTDLPAVLVSQTTVSEDMFHRTEKAFLKRFPEGHILDSLCATTVARRRSALSVCRQTDAAVIVGGRNSANTARLNEACGRYVPTTWIETASELSTDMFDAVSSVAVISGASTPDWIMDEVIQWLKNH